MATPYVPSDASSGNPTSPQYAVQLSPATVAQIRAALVEALQHHGGDLEAAAEPGLSGRVRDFENQMRSAIQALDGVAPTGTPADHPLVRLWAERNAAAYAFNNRTTDTTCENDPHFAREIACEHELQAARPIDPMGLAIQVHFILDTLKDSVPNEADEAMLAHVAATLETMAAAQRPLEPDTVRVKIIGPDEKNPELDFRAGDTLILADSWGWTEPGVYLLGNGSYARLDAPPDDGTDILRIDAIQRPADDGDAS